jgi:hypothetical protein
MDKFWFKILKGINLFLTVVLSITLFLPMIVLLIILLPIIIPWSYLDKYISKTEENIKHIGGIYNE